VLCFIKLARLALFNNKTTPHQHIYPFIMVQPTPTPTPLPTRTPTPPTQQRPFDPSKVTNTSGEWCWIGLPRSILVNGKGSFSDCEDVYDRQVRGSIPLPFSKSLFLVG